MESDPSVLLPAAQEQLLESWQKILSSRQNPAPEPGELIFAYTYISSEIII